MSTIYIFAWKREPCPNIFLHFISNFRMNFIDTYIRLSRNSSSSTETCTVEIFWFNGKTQNPNRQSSILPYRGVRSKIESYLPIWTTTQKFSNRRVIPSTTFTVRWRKLQNQNGETFTPGQMSSGSLLFAAGYRAHCLETTKSPKLSKNFPRLWEWGEISSKLSFLKLFRTSAVEVHQKLLSAFNWTFQKFHHSEHYIIPTCSPTSQIKDQFTEVTKLLFLQLKIAKFRL